MSNGSGTQKGRHLLLQMPSFLSFIAKKDAYVFGRIFLLNFALEAV